MQVKRDDNHYQYLSIHVSSNNVLKTLSSSQLSICIIEHSRSIYICGSFRYFSSNRIIVSRRGSPIGSKFWLWYVVTTKKSNFCKVLDFLDFCFTIWQNFEVWKTDVFLAIFEHFQAHLQIAAKNRISNIFICNKSRFVGFR